MIVTLPLTSGFYVSSSLPISGQQAINCFVHLPDAPALNQQTLLGTPGIRNVGTTGESVTDANRGSSIFKGRAHFVNGASLYRLNDDETIDYLGDIQGVGRVTMASNGSQLMILSPGAQGYIFTENPDTLQEITDTDFRANGNPLYVAFVDGYFVCTTDENKFIISALNNGLSYNALDFGTAESNPDDVVIPFVYKNQLFIAGKRTLEGFSNIGGTEFPFQRTGLFLDEGVVSPFSAITTENSVLFVGAGENEGPAIWGLVNNSTEKVSSQAVDSLLQKLSAIELGNVWSWSYGQSGHYFVGFVLPDTTIVFDTTTGLWHERISRVPLPGGDYATETYRVATVVSANGNLYVSDGQDGRIGVLDLDLYTEYGNEIPRIFTTQPFQDQMQPFFTPMIELTVQSGVGDFTTRDPVVRMSLSKDGKTFSHERERPLGRVGEYSRRAVWRRNPRTDRFDVYRFVMTDPVKFVAIQLNADIKANQNVAA